MAARQKIGKLDIGVVLAGPRQGERFMVVAGEPDVAGAAEVPAFRRDIFEIQRLEFPGRGFPDKCVARDTAAAFFNQGGKFGYRAGAAQNRTVGADPDGMRVVPAWQYGLGAGSDQVAWRRRIYGVDAFISIEAGGAPFIPFGP